MVAIKEQSSCFLLSYYSLETILTRSRYRLPHSGHKAQLNSTILFVTEHDQNKVELGDVHGDLAPASSIIVVRSTPQFLKMKSFF